MTSLEKLRKEFIETQCEKAEDADYFEIYENNAELVVDWWLVKFQSELTAICEEVEKEKSGSNKERWKYYDLGIDEALEVIRGRMG